MSLEPSNSFSTSSSTSLVSSSIPSLSTSLTSPSKSASISSPDPTSRSPFHKSIPNTPPSYLIIEASSDYKSNNTDIYDYNIDVDLEEKKLAQPLLAAGHLNRISYSINNYSNNNHQQNNDPNHNRSNQDEREGTYIPPSVSMSMSISGRYNQSLSLTQSHSQSHSRISYPSNDDSSIGSGWVYDSTRILAHQHSHSTSLTDSNDIKVSSIKSNHSNDIENANLTLNSLCHSDEFPMTSQYSPVSKRPLPPPFAQCRICLEVDPFPRTSTLISPCLCSGSNSYVHRHCLDNWRVIGLGDSMTKCESCGFIYDYEDNCEESKEEKEKRVQDWRWSVGCEIALALTLFTFFLALLAVLSYVLDKTNDYTLRSLIFPSSSPLILVYFVISLILFFLFLSFCGLCTSCCLCMCIPVALLAHESSSLDPTTLTRSGWSSFYLLTSPPSALPSGSIDGSGVHEMAPHTSHCSNCCSTHLCKNEAVYIVVILVLVLCIFTGLILGLSFAFIFLRRAATRRWMRLWRLKECQVIKVVDWNNRWTEREERANQQKLVQNNYYPHNSQPQHHYMEDNINRENQPSPLALPSSVLSSYRNKSQSGKSNTIRNVNVAPIIPNTANTSIIDSTFNSRSDSISHMSLTLNAPANTSTSTININSPAISV